MSDKKMSYKPGIAMILWGVFLLMLFFQNKAIVYELTDVDIDIVNLTAFFACFSLFLAGMMHLLAVTSRVQYEHNLETHAKINEKHLCPDCAKFMNDRHLRMARVTTDFTR